MDFAFVLSVLYCRVARGAIGSLLAKRNQVVSRASGSPAKVEKGSLHVRFFFCKYSNSVNTSSDGRRESPSLRRSLDTHGWGCWRPLGVSKKSKFEKLAVRRHKFRVSSAIDIDVARDKLKYSKFVAYIESGSVCIGVSETQDQHVVELALHSKEEAHQDL
eukprot:6474678-Amphidinium_carterae.1